MLRFSMRTRAATVLCAAAWLGPARPGLTAGGGWAARLSPKN